MTDSPQYGVSTGQGLLASIPSSSISSITVLKGPVATAQYGAEGANGVIVIETKKGVKGETKYSVSYQRGVVSRAVEFPNMVNASQWNELWKEGQRNALLTDSNPKNDDKTVSNFPLWNGKRNTNWVDLMSRDNPVTQQFSLSASGGSEKATYYGSISFQNSDNVVINSGYKRYGAQFNFTYNFNENIDITNQFTGSYSQLKGIREGSAYYANPLSAPLFFRPTAPAYNEDGSIYTGKKLPFYNPLFIAKYDISRSRNYRLINSTKLNINILENLNFHSEVGIDYSLLAEKTYSNPVESYAAANGGLARSVDNKVFKGTWQNGLSYKWTINNDHSFSARVVNVLKIYKQRQLIAASQGFATLGVTNVASGARPINTYAGLVEGSTVSLLGKVHYSYKDKLLLDVLVRRDGNSRFAESRRWGTFYAIGAGWIISAEDFLDDSEVIDFLKVKASYGTSGNNAIGRNEFQRLLGFSVAYGGNPAINPVQLGNPRLTWEKKRSVEAGISFGLFNRIDGDITIFRNKTTDLLYGVPLSRTTGFSEQLRNVGDLVNKGLEVSLNADVLRTNDLLVSISGNFTYIKNEVTNLPVGQAGEELSILDRMRYIAEGHPVHEWYMRTWAGVNPKNGLPLWEVNDGDNVKGELTSEYLKANPEYQSASPIPTHYGSVGITVNYKGFYAGASLYGSFGNKIYDGFAEYYHSDGEYSFGNMADQLDRWQEPGDITDTPRRIAGGNHNSNGTSTRFLYDASFLRLQTARIGYNVPASLLKELGIGVRSLNIYVTGRNLWTYTYDDDLQWDPVTDATGFQDVSNPTQEAYTVGIQIQF